MPDPRVMRRLRDALFLLDCFAGSSTGSAFARRSQLRRLFLHQLDEMVDDVGVFQAVVGEAADIDLMRAVAAAGEADIGLARFARTVDDTTDDRNGQRRRDVREALLQPLDRLDHLELLARAGRAGDDGDPAAPQVKRFQHPKPALTSSTESADSETRIVSPIPDHSIMPSPIEDLTVPLRKPPGSVIPMERIVAGAARGWQATRRPAEGSADRRHCRLPHHPFRRWAQFPVIPVEPGIFA